MASLEFYILHAFSGNGQMPPKGNPEGTCAGAREVNSRLSLVLLQRAVQEHMLEITNLCTQDREVNEQRLGGAFGKENSLVKLGLTLLQSLLL